MVWVIQYVMNVTTELTIGADDLPGHVSVFEWQEERDYAQEVMKICFPDDSETDKDGNEACR